MCRTFLNSAGLNLEIYFQVRGTLLDNKQSYLTTVKVSSMKEIKGAGSSFCIVMLALCLQLSKRAPAERNLVPFPYNNFKRLLLRKQAKIQNSKFDRIKFGVFAVRVRAI